MFVKTGMRNGKLWQISSIIVEELIGNHRCYSTKTGRLDLRKLRPMILERIGNRAKEYPVKPMVPVALEVLKARTVLYRGVSTLMQHIHVWACKYCPEVYIGGSGHLIRTCGGYRHRTKNQVHQWVKGNINDILVPVEAFHLKNMFQDEIKHDQRFDFDRISAVVELCLQAGASPSDQSLHSNSPCSDVAENDMVGGEHLSDDNMRLIARQTLDAWEKLRSGVQRLLFIYPAKVCKHCSEVHIGPSGHKARLCGVFKYESWRGTHFWRKAQVDDLVPPKMVWFRRAQDPPVLLDKGRDFYGHAPAVVDLCSKGGAIVPTKYFCMMKMDGLTAPIPRKC